MSDVHTSHNSEDQRYEARIDGELAGFAAYELTDRAVVFTHTVVHDAFEGQGVGSAMARFALDDVRAGTDGAGRRVVAKCSFMAGWIDKHPEYADLLARD